MWCAAFKLLKMRDLKSSANSSLSFAGRPVGNVGFAAVVEAIVEVLLGVGGISENDMVTAILARCQNVVPVVSIEAGSAKKVFHPLVGTLCATSCLEAVCG